MSPLSLYFSNQLDSMLQAANGHEECCDALLHVGADVTNRDNRGRSPLHMAAMCGHVGLLGALILVGSTFYNPEFFEEKM